MKLSAFKERVKKAQKLVRANKNKRKKLQVNLDDVDFDAVASIDISGGRVLKKEFIGDTDPIVYPPPNDIKGYRIYESSVVAVPGGKKSSMVLRDKCAKGLRPICTPKDSEEWALRVLAEDEYNGAGEPLVDKIDRILHPEVYRDAVAQLSSLTDIRFKDRVTTDKLAVLLQGDHARPHSREVDDPLHGLLYDLAVVDITMNIPRTAPVEGINDNPLKPELLDFVGIFSSQSTQESPSLDLGLFKWETFKRSRQEALKVYTRPEDGLGFDDNSGAHPILNQTMPNNRSSLSSSSVSGFGALSNNRWLDPAAQPEDTIDPPQGSGVAVYNTTLPSGKIFECRLLSEPISQSYAERTLTRQVCEWLSIEMKRK